MNPIRVMLLEDGLHLAAQLNDDLADKHRVPIELTCGSSLDWGLAHLQAGHPVDVLLLDLALLRSCAPKTSEKFLAETPPRPVVFLVGSESEALGLCSLPQGTPEYLVKSECTPKMLVWVLRFAVEKHRLEEDVRTSERHAQRLIDSTTDYVYSVRFEADEPVTTHYSRSIVKVIGYRAEELAADPNLWFQMVHEHDRAAVLEQIDLIRKGVSPAPIEHRIAHKDGTVRWIRNAIVLHRDLQGRLTSYEGLVSDITERKRAEEELRQAFVETAHGAEALKKALAELEVSNQKLKLTQLKLIQAAKLESIGTLAAGVAHEVKNPLQTILMGLAYLVHRTSPEDADIALALHEMHDAVKRADGIIRELLQLSAATQVSMQEEDLNAVVDSALSLVHYESLASQINVVRQLDANLPPVCLDRNKMEQVFVNLFLNACQATAQGGTLTVRTRAERWTRAARQNAQVEEPIQPGDRVVIAEIQDTGIGITQGDLARVFDPFFTTKPTGVGTGLGLSVIKTIIDLHGGIVGIENVAGGGVRVTLVLKTLPPRNPLDQTP